MSSLTRTYQAQGSIRRSHTARLNLDFELLVPMNQEVGLDSFDTYKVPWFE